MASIKGNPEVDEKYAALVKTLKSESSTKILRNLNQKTLRSAVRELKKITAELEFYLDVRNEQGRGGKK